MAWKQINASMLSVVIIFSNFLKYLHLRKKISFEVFLFFFLSRRKSSIQMLILIPNCYKNRTLLSYLRLQFFMSFHFPRAVWHSSSAAPAQGQSSTTQAGMNCSGQKWWLSCLSPFPVPYYICNLAACSPGRKCLPLSDRKSVKIGVKGKGDRLAPGGGRHAKEPGGSLNMGAWSSYWKL